MADKLGVNARQYQSIPAGLPEGNCPEGICAGDCPEDQVSRPGSAQKTANVRGELSGTVGIEITEQDRVEVRDVSIRNANQEINFGDIRVVQALSDINECEASRTSTVLLEIPFSMQKSGEVVVDLAAFTEMVARARNVQVTNNNFTTTPNNPVAPPTDTAQAPL